MKTALIGYTGFVGGNLLKQMPFTDLFNSKNIESIRGQSFDSIVCAGVRAEKWKANQNPAEDRFGIEELIRSLDQVHAGEFILISTVDVYPDPTGVYEDSRQDWNLSMPYGRHRRQLEEAVASKFRARIIRLPGLYGTGLKKNIIYDFLHHNMLDKIDADSQLQYYGLHRLSGDIHTMREHDLQLLNAVTEPVTIRDVAQSAFSRSFENHTVAGPVRYDIRTRHANVWGVSGDYLENRTQVMNGLRQFVQQMQTSL